MPQTHTFKHAGYSCTVFMISIGIWAWQARNPDEFLHGQVEAYNRVDAEYETKNILDYAKASLEIK